MDWILDLISPPFSILEEKNKNATLEHLGRRWIVVLSSTVLYTFSSSSRMQIPCFSLCRVEERGKERMKKLKVEPRAQKDGSNQIRAALARGILVSVLQMILLLLPKKSHLFPHPNVAFLLISFFLPNLFLHYSLYSFCFNQIYKQNV